MRPLLAGNWKMNGSRESVRNLLLPLKENFVNDTMQMVVFPPFVFLDEAAQLLQGSDVVWGAQNLSSEEQGAFTGEISAGMLVDFGCRFVIVGHSERRTLYGETDHIVAKKCQKALEHGLTPIVCVGESHEERLKGETERVVERQLSAIINALGVEALARIVLAYEPIWAIGTGLSASNAEAEAVHAFLKRKVAEKDAMIAKKLPILYGGSLKASNAEALFSMPNIDGGLVGGASLDAKEFLEMGKILKKVMLCKN